MLTKPKECYNMCQRIQRLCHIFINKANANFERKKSAKNEKNNKLHSE